MVTESSEADGRTDLYALGGVACWLLTGQTPFEGRSLMATIMAQVNEEPPALSEVTDAELPPALEALIMRCLAKKPEQRPASAEALAEALDALELAEGVEGWSTAQATRWWDMHKPTTHKRPLTRGSKDPAQLTKAVAFKSTDLV